MSYDIINKINSPEDLKRLDKNEIAPLCAEIREFLVDKVQKSGGHLASNLGIVELSVALHRVFDSPKDHIIFDVGHQAYVHKILTGRCDSFDELRRTGGLSGFTSRRESEHDPFGAGHSSTALSAALGFAEGDKLLGKDSYTVAVVGDGAYTGGMVHEAINNCKEDLRLIVVLNENGMSISQNKGLFASFLSRFRSSKRYINAKKSTKEVLRHIPLLGKPLAWCFASLKDLVTKMVYRPNYFEQLGFCYTGLIDGNDYEKVENALIRAKETGKCVFVHIKTTKGKGYTKAETEPETFHSIVKMPSSEENATSDTDRLVEDKSTPVNIRTLDASDIEELPSKGGEKPDTSSNIFSSYHAAFADALKKEAEEHPDIVAVTAAMGIGTGLSEFGEKYPDRCFDVGIAEEHALTFSAGLAANGLKPYAAIYSTFLQRGYDNIIHDIALQSLPVNIFIDRAGLAVSDGATHHGIFDVAFLSHIPGIEIIAPVDYESLARSVSYAYSSPLATAVRYPNAPESLAVKEHFTRKDGWIRYDFDPSDPPENIFITYGALAERVISAKELLTASGKNVGIVLIEMIKPYDKALGFLRPLIRDGMHIVYAEEGIKNGGAAMILGSMLESSGLLSGSVRYDIAAIDDNFATPCEKCELYDYVGLSPERLAEYFS